MLLKHTLIYVIARGIPGIANFFAIAIYTRLLDPSAFGRYALVVSSVGLANVALFQWLRVGLVRFMPATSSPQQLLGTIRRAFLISVVLTGIGGVVVIWFWGDSANRQLLIIAIPLVWLQAWFELQRELARSQFKPALYGALSASKSILALIIGIGAVYWLGMEELGPLLGLGIGMLMAIVLWGSKDWFVNGIQPSSALMNTLLRYGLPLTGSFLMVFIIGTSDRFALLWLIDEHAAGVYSAAYDLGQQTLTLLMSTINLAAFPLAMRALDLGSVEKAQHQLSRNFMLLLNVALPACMLLAFLSNNIAMTLLGASFEQAAARLIPWVSIGVFLSGLRAFHFDAAFHLMKGTHWQMVPIGLGALVNVGLNLWWIPHFGVMGAAYSTVVAYAAALIVSALVGRRIFKVPVPLRTTLTASLATATMIVAIWPTLRLEGAGALAGQLALATIVYAAMFVILNKEAKAFLAKRIGLRK